MSIPESNTPPRNHNYWLYYGSGFAIVVLGIFLYAFFVGDLSCDRWYLINMVYPIFAGISAGAFLGSISITGEIRKMAIIAGGGFAVFVLAFSFSQIPDRCVGLQVTNFTLFDSTHVEGSQGSQRPISLQASREVLRVSDIENFVIFYGFVVSNIMTVTPNKLALEVKSEGLTRDNKVAWDNVTRLHSTEDWKTYSLPDSDKGNNYKNFLSSLGLSEDDKLSTMIPIGLTVECFNDEEIRQWNKVIRITVDDKLSDRSTTFSIELQVDDRIISSENKKSCEA